MQHMEAGLSSCQSSGGWAIDHTAPDIYDVAGALLCLFGVAVIMYAPR